MNISGPAAVAKPEMLFYAPGDLTVTLQLGTEYLFPEIGVRLWRERAFHLKLLKDPLYMEEMQAVLEDEYQYQYFQMVTVMG